MRNVAVSLGGMTWSAEAVVQPAVAAAPCVTPRRKETVAPGATVRDFSDAEPKKSVVVWVGRVLSGCPLWLRNWIPG